MTGGITSPDAGWRQADRGPATQRKGRKRKRGGGRKNAEIAMVDDVEFTSYYGRSVRSAIAARIDDDPAAPPRNR